MRKSLIIILMLWQTVNAQSTAIDRALHDITMEMRRNVFSAPVASRIYAYTTYAGYLALGCGDVIQFSERPCPVSPASTIQSDTVAALAMYLTAMEYLYEDSTFRIIMASNIGDIKPSDKRYQLAHGIAMDVVKWSASDHYVSVIAMERYTIKKQPLSWEPTPPDYASGTDPNWGKIKPFVYRYDSLNLAFPDFIRDTIQLKKQAIEVLQLTSNEDSAKQQIALFWDDNPFILRQSGHLSYIEKKVSPPGHWLDITRVALDSQRADICQRMQAYTFVSIAMADAMIAVWGIKYDVQLLRPETYINKYIDADWRPYIQSPPFPEFPSGHSAVSAAAATILTYLFGSEVMFSDASESMYGLPSRSFTSFNQAALEASQSRVYGGIHFSGSTDFGAKIGVEAAQAFIMTIGQR